MIDGDYIKTLEKRLKTNRIVEDFQDTALQLVDLLGDKKHVALYMKLAKQHPKHILLRVAKDVSQRAHVEHKGAYFMKVLKEEGYFEKRNKKVPISNDKEKHRNRRKK